MKYKYLILSAFCIILTNCTKKQDVNGWYFITDKQTQAFDKLPIVTVADFETLRVDSTLNSENAMTYVITGQMKADKIKTWADATEKAIGKQIGFLYNGEIISAPQVNARIEMGHFQISSQKLSKDREKMLGIYKALKEEAK